MPDGPGMTVREPTGKLTLADSRFWPSLADQAGELAVPEAVIKFKDGPQLTFVRGTTRLPRDDVAGRWFHPRCLLGALTWG